MPPPCRIKHNKRSTFVEELLVQWEPEECTLQEARQQQKQGFDITSITSLEAGAPTPLLEKPTAAKRPRGRPRAADIPPPSPTTKCLVHFAPFPQGPTHIRTIQGGATTLEVFLVTENTLPPLETPMMHGTPGLTPTKRSLTAQSSSRTKRKEPTLSSLPSSPTRPLRRACNVLLQIITEK